MASMVPQFIEDRVLRARVALHKTHADRYRVYIARDVESYKDAFKLLHVAYVYQGIEAIRGVDMRITPQHVLPESTVFVAYEGDKIVGTMTLTLDSPAGVPLEKDYPEALAELRSLGARPVEIGSLAVVRRCWHTGVTTLLNMAAVWFARHTLRASHLVMGVNPRAQGFYRAMFGFKPLGEARQHAELVAPTIGMQVSLEGLKSHLERWARKPMSTGQPVYAHFFQQLPDCIEMPDAAAIGDLARWKLPREVFQQIFIVQSDRLSSLDPRTREYLQQLRSESTLNADSER